MNFFTKEVKIAVVSIIGLVLLFFGLNFLKGKSLFSNNNSYFAHFDNVSGLSASNAIFAGGYQVGTVKGISYDFEHGSGVMVELSIDKALNIPEGSEAEIVSDMMGNVKLNLLLAPAGGKLVAVGDTLQGHVNDGIMGVAAKLVPTIEQMLPKVDSILASVNALMADPALAQTLHNAEKISGNLTTTTADLNRLMAQVNGQLPALMGKVGTTLDKATSTLDNTSKITANLATVDVAQTMAKVDATLANVQSITDKLNSKEGSIGLLMNDPAMYNNINAALVSTDSLIIDLKAHPKRYVHFSLFGKKDK